MNKMQIRVKYAIDFDSVTLEVSPHDTIGHVKSILRDLGVFLSQYLLVSSDSMTLDDSCTLIGCGIQDGALLRFSESQATEDRDCLVLQDADEISDDDDDPLSPIIPDEAAIHASRSSTGQVFRDAIHGIQAAEPITGHRPPETITLHVHLTFSSISMYIEVLVSNTVDELKSIISRRTGYHTDYFVLLLDGTLLDNGSCTLEQCGIKDHGLCQAYRKEPERIRVRLPSNPYVCPVPEFMIKVTPLETVGETKEKIKKITGIPPEEQLLKYRGLLLDGDERLLLTYFDFGNLATASVNNAIILIPPSLDRSATMTINSLSSSSSSSSCYSRGHLPLP